MKIKPHSYQNSCLKHCLTKKISALFLDMGLGKTVIVLTAINYLLNARKIKGVLILAPLRVAHDVWPEEIKKWDHLKHLSCVVLHGPHKDKLLKEKNDIYVVNYDGLLWLTTALEVYKRDKFPFDMLVLDESTAVKNHQTKRFKMLKNIVGAFKRRVILTGTPAPNTLEDLWAQYFLLDGGQRLGVSKWGFRNRFFYQSDYFGHKYRPKPSAPEEISNRVKDITVRLTAEDYLEMPRLIRNNVRWSMSSKTARQYKQFERTFLANIWDETVVAVNAAALSTKLRQFLSGFVYDDSGQPINVHEEKLDVLQETIERHPGEQVLVAIQFRYEYDMIAARYPKVPVIYGGLSSNIARSRIRAWNDMDSPLLVVHPASLAHGVNLQQGGRTIVWYSLPWSYEHYIQLRARLYRQGQTKPVMLHHLIAKDTVELDVVQALQDKRTSETSFTKRLVSILRSRA